MAVKPNPSCIWQELGFIGTPASLQTSDPGSPFSQVRTKWEKPSPLRGLAPCIRVRGNMVQCTHSPHRLTKILQTSGSRVGRNVVHSRFPLQTINLNKPLRIFKTFASGSGAHSAGPHLRGPRRSGRLFLTALHISSRMTRELQRVLHSGVVSSLLAGGSLQPALLTLIPTNFAAEPSQRGKWVRRVLHGEQRGQTAGAKKPAGFAPTPISPRLRPFCQRSKEVAAALPCSAVLGKQRKWAG